MPVFRKPLQLPLSQEDLNAINAHLTTLPPEDVLRWGMEYLPNLYQTTALGPTGLVTMDILSKISTAPPPLIFLDTLYHFPETYELLEVVKEQYDTPLHVFRPQGCETVSQFEDKYGQKLWEVNEHAYDYAVKVEPARRAYNLLGVQSVITGRRATQGGDRANLKTLEVDATGLLKLNPLVSWSFDLVKMYIDINDVPRNKLLDQGYRSIGDWHSTNKVGDGQGERDGRWAGTSKTECGLHKDYYQIKALAKAALQANDTTHDPTPAPATIGVTPQPPASLPTIPTNSNTSTFDLAPPSTLQSTDPAVVTVEIAA